MKKRHFIAALLIVCLITVIPIVLLLLEAAMCNQFSDSMLASLLEMLEQ